MNEPIAGGFALCGLACKASQTLGERGAAGFLGAAGAVVATTGGAALALADSATTGPATGGVLAGFSEPP